jgi:ELWxxDGT repeat protein
MIRANRVAKRPQRLARLGLEALEDRRLLTLAPELVLDANQSGDGALVSSLTSAALQSFFIAGNNELWRTDGTPDGTRLVVDLGDQGPITSPGMTALGNSVVFTIGDELWISDGTAVGTQPLVDLSDKGPVSAAGMLRYGNSLVFTLGNELWISDGTTAETRRLNPDLRLLHNPFYGGLSAEWNGVLYFSATSSATGGELWRTDGTIEGTRLVADINAGAANGDTSSLLVFNDRLFFAAQDASLTRDVWQTDGTPEGISRFFDVGDAFQGVYQAMAAANDTFFFTVGAYHSAVGRTKVWLSDGTAAGTRALSSVSPQFNNKLLGGPLMAVGDVVYMMLHQGAYSLARSDGTVEGTMLLASTGIPDTSNRVRGFAAVGERLLLAIEGQFDECQYWTSDGSPAGSSVVSLSFEGCNSLAVVDGIGYFRDDGVLWKTDGTGAGTGPVDPDFPGDDWASVRSLVPAGHNLLFTANDPRYGRQLFKTDGTAAGTSRLTRSVFTSKGSGASQLQVTKDRLFYGASSVGLKIFSSNGETEGTFPLWNLDVEDPRENDVDAPFNVSPVRTTKAHAFFVSQDIAHGKTLNVADGAAPAYTRLLTIPLGHYVVMEHMADRHLFFHFTDAYGKVLSGTWTSDGTIEGTHVLEGIPDLGSVSVNNYLSFRGDTYFVATFNQGQDERSELWRFDEENAAAERVTDLNGHKFCGQLATDDFDLFASLSTPEYGCELWRIDGASFETTMVDDLRPGELGSYPSYAVGRDGDLYFVARTSPSPEVYDYALFRLHGDEYTSITDVSSFSPGVFANGDYYFFKQDGNATQLWRTTGTLAGAVKVSKSPDEVVLPFVLSTTGGHVFYLVRTSRDFGQMWQSDGTAEGTRPIPNLVVPFNAGVVTALNGAVYFRADDGIYGTELWKLDPPPGDTNFDGSVDVVDLNHVRNHFGETGSVLGDANGDGVVNLLDLNAVRNYFGTETGSRDATRPTASAAAAPSARIMSRVGTSDAERSRASDLLFVASQDNTMLGSPTHVAAKKLRAIDRVFAAI